MIRHTLVIPGNDCIYGACCVVGCEGKRGWTGTGHGISSEHWYYVVRRGGPYATLADGEGPALSLEVSTDIYPETVPRDHSKRCGVYCNKCRHGAHDSRVCGVEFTERQPAGWPQACDCPAKPLAELRRGIDISLHSPIELENAIISRESCVALGGRPCWVRDTSALYADELFTLHGDPSQNTQPESFWLKMEAELEEWTK